MCSTHWTQLIALNLADNELGHICSCKGLVEAWKILCNIHETRNLSNIFFHSPQVLHLQDKRRWWLIGPHQQGEDTCGLTHLFRGIHDKRRCYQDFARELVTLVRTLDHLLGDHANEWVYVGTFDTQNVWKDEKEPQGDNAAMVLHKDKGDNSSHHKDIKTYYYYSKLSHITRFYYKAKKERNNTKNTKEDDEYAFVMQHEIRISYVSGSWIQEQRNIWFPVGRFLTHMR